MKKEITLHTFMSNPNAIIVDVRTPSEYKLGHIEGAYNLPIFEDNERAEVGTIYKQIGRNQAVERGLEIVGPKLARFVRDAHKIAKDKELYLYCWRGGMRSGSMAWLLSTAGLKVSLLKGGYKSYRSEFEELLTLPWKFIILGGKTGCGKSDILHEMELLGEQVLDLEGLANHKGSVFGGIGMGEQPSTETFINRIHQKLRDFDPQRAVWCEGESMLIGHVYIPEKLFAILNKSPLIDFDLEQESRIKRLVKEYGSFEIEHLITAFNQIRKRLGNDNLKEALEALNQGDISQAARIALRYYDKGYTLSTSKRSGGCIASYLSNEDNPKLSAEKLKEIYYNNR